MSVHRFGHRGFARATSGPLLVGATAVVLLAACGSSGSGGGSAGGNSSGDGNGSGEAATLEFQTALAADSPLLGALTEVTDAFSKRYPDIKVELRTSGSDYESQIKIRLAGNNPPDIFATHGWSLDRYSQFLVPQQDRPWAKYFNPALSSVMKNDKGEFFALPIDTDISGVVINRAVLAKADVEPASLTTWPGLMAGLKAVAASGVTPLTLAAKDGASGQAVDWLAPGSFSDAELKGFQDGKFQTDAYAKLLGILDGFRTSGYLNNDYSVATRDDSARALATGKAAITFSSNEIITRAWKLNPDADLAFVPIAASGGGQPYLLGGEATAYGLSKTGKHVTQAQQYLDFLAQPDNTSKLAAAVGNYPGLTDAKPSTGKLTESFDTWVKPNKYRLQPFFDRKYLPNGAWDTVVSSADSVLAGQAAPPAAASTMAAAFDTLYKGKG